LEEFFSTPCKKGEKENGGRGGRDKKRDRGEREEERIERKEEGGR
jgi:hypothetical protein